ncbi:hypothetical protein OSL61_29775, partial [Escherichia coli]|nr:hypothetical protein [Escherichia coli]
DKTLDAIDEKFLFTDRDALRTKLRDMTSGVVNKWNELTEDELYEEAMFVMRTLTATYMAKVREKVIESIKMEREICALMTES